MLAMLSMALMLFFVGCTGAERTLDFRSIGCAETGQIVSLNDRRSAFDEIFGEAESLGHDIYRYLDGSLEVDFPGGGANGVQVNAYPHGDRVEFHNFSWDMNLQDMHEHFTPSDFMNDEGGIFNRFFDASGNEVSQEESEYTMVVAYFYPAGIVYVVLHQNT